jgi:hypothetical protein
MDDPKPVPKEEEDDIRVWPEGKPKKKIDPDDQKTANAGEG